MKVNPKRLLGMAGIFLATIVFTLLAGSDSLPVVGSVFQFAFLIGVPGALIASLLGLGRSGGLLFVLYGLGLGLLSSILGGLLVNALLPVIGVARPLSLAPLVVYYDALVIVLTLLWASRHNLPRPGPVWPKLTVARRDIFLAILPVVFVPLAAMGAISLNNGGPNYFTIILLSLVALYVLGIGFIKTKPAAWVYPAALFSIAASLLLMYSLRSWHIIGADVNLEFQVFSAVLAHGHWQTHSLLSTEYNACLSITVLPAQLAVLTHLQPEYVYKLLMQLLFAFAPVMIYALCRYQLGPKGAFFAGFAFAAQTWFIEQMPALIRQETALLFFILVCISLFDRTILLWQQRILFVAFTAGVIMSHYSTAYIYLALLLVAWTISTVARLSGRLPRLRQPRITLMRLLVGVVLIIAWEGLITAAGGSFVVFAKAAAGHATDAFTAQAISRGVAQITFSGDDTSSEQNLLKKYQEVTRMYSAERPHDFVAYPAEVTAAYRPEVAEGPQPLPSLAPGIVSKVFLLAGKISKLLIVNVLSIIGLFVLALRLRRADPRSREYVYVSAATLPLVATMLFLPVASTSYNTTRLFLQVYIMLVCMAIFGAYYLTHRFLDKRWKEPVLAILLAVFLLYSTGFMYQLLGGPSRVTLNRSLGGVEAYYIEDAEVAGARWLGANRESGVPVYADEMAKLRIESFGGVNDSEIESAIFPTTISQNAYVYLDSANTARGQGIARHPLGNDVIFYKYPTSFLDEQKDLIYSNGGSTIYR